MTIPVTAAKPIMATSAVVNRPVNFIASNGA
jgi:hypothetical protein